jgi:hypothetical protein
MTEEMACTKSNNGHDFPHVPSASLSHVNPYVREMKIDQYVTDIHIIAFNKFEKGT